MTHNDSTAAPLVAPSDRVASVTSLRSVPPVAVGVCAVVAGVNMVRDTIRRHVCPENLMVVVTLPEHGQTTTLLCVDCIEDSDPLDLLHRLIPGSMVSASIRPA